MELRHSEADSHCDSPAPHGFSKDTPINITQKLTQQDTILNWSLQNADLANTANECELKLNKVKKLLQETLWTNSGSWEVSTALRAAESGIIHAAAAQPCGEEACEFILTHLQGLVKTANEIYGQWQRWMPPEVQERVEFSLSRLELGIPQLIHQKVDFIPAAIPPNDHVPTMKLKPTAVPKCSGNRFDLQCWGKDCEAPKRQNKSNTNHAGCVVCGSMQHKKKLFFCKHFRALKLTEKEAAVSKLGACEKCLEVHDDGPYSCKPNFICNNQDCKDEHTPDHHYCLCPKAELKKSNWVQKKVRFHRKEPHCCASSEHVAGGTNVLASEPQTHFRYRQETNTYYHGDFSLYRQRVWMKLTFYEMNETMLADVNDDDNNKKKKFRLTLAEKPSLKSWKHLPSSNKERVWRQLVELFSTIVSVSGAPRCVNAWQLQQFAVINTCEPDVAHIISSAMKGICSSVMISD
ncbi:hypothetical protein JOB18_022240 [Solea senegalensis]|uniref:Uncharacterized protein n=1 Tax=Solea senegalensis TaxID=28829 RepID=A0AAV6SSL5_SOLSE|nr:hypothetical protein JOB18_022240 [Solea senegalensis]